MKKGTALFLRLAVPIGAAALLLTMPLTDRFLGGQKLILPAAVYDTPGDTDGNGRLDLDDVRTLRAMYQNGTQPDAAMLPVADLNGDRVVDADDAGILLRYLSDENAADMTPDQYYKMLAAGRTVS